MTLIFTSGDPLSVNMEGFLRAVVPSMARHRAIVGIGSLWQLENQATALNLKVPELKVISRIEEANRAGVHWVDSSINARKVDARDLTLEERGKMAVDALQHVPQSYDSPIAVLTAPINKKAAALAGFSHPGQTEFFEKLWQKRAVMLLAGPSLRVALATNHLPLKSVSEALTIEMLVQKIKILHESLSRLYSIEKARIGVCGLNPHCGDEGLFGREEDTVIRPAVKMAQGLGIMVDGPFPADTIFYRSMQGEYDVVLAMYHDQGLGPLKTVHFDEAVNVSLGLNHLRVSPDHGPAADLFLTGKASMRSFDAALKLCERWLGENYGA